MSSIATSHSLSVSPLRRRTWLNRSAVRRHASYSTSPEFHLRDAGTGVGSGPDYFADMWRPGLLDHLHEPLTRFHE